MFVCTLPINVITLGWYVRNLTCFQSCTKIKIKNRQWDIKKKYSDYKLFQDGLFFVSLSGDGTQTF